MLNYNIYRKIDTSIEHLLENIYDLMCWAVFLILYYEYFRISVFWMKYLTTISHFVIIQWNQLKTKPTRDRILFITILFSRSTSLKFFQIFPKFFLVKYLKLTFSALLKSLLKTSKVFFSETVLPNIKHFFL